MAKNEIKASEWKTPTTIWNSMFLSIFFSSFMLNVSQQMSNTNLSLYAKSLGAGSDQIGILSSCFAITAFFFRFISGPAMKSFNRKRLLAMAMGFMTVAYFGFSFSKDIADAMGWDPINVMKAFRLLQGVGNAFGNSCAMTIAADFIPKDKFSTGMGYFALGQALSSVIGPKLGTAMSDAMGFHKTYIIVAFCMMSAIVVESLIVKNIEREKIPFKLKLNDMVAVEALIPAFVVFLVASGATAVSAFFYVYAEEYGIAKTDASWYFTISAACMFVTRPIIGKLTDKYGFGKIGPVAICMTAASLVLIGLSCYYGQLWLLLLTGVINSCGYGAATPALQSLCIKSVSTERRGSGSATYYIGMDGGTIVGPIICGFIADKVGYTPVMWIAVAVPVLLGAAVAIIGRKRIRTIEDEFAARTAQTE